MSEKKDKKQSDADAELQREIRAGRKFTLGEAIGRMAGSGALKGVSAIRRKKQAQTAIEEFLSHHLADHQRSSAGRAPAACCRERTTPPPL